MPVSLGTRVGAPDTAYKDERIGALENGANTSGALNRQRMMEIAEFLSEYGTKANIKSKLRLDKLLVVRRNGADYGFVGLTKAGGNNESYHAQGLVTIRTTNSSLGEMKHSGYRTSSFLLRTDGGNYRAYYDGGLNTMGHAAVSSMGTSGYVYQNYQQATFALTAAYWLTTSYKMYLNGSLMESTSLARKATANKSYSANTRQEGETFEAKVVVTNNEGTKTFTRTATILPAITGVTATKLASLSSNYDSGGTATACYVYQADYNTAHTGAAGLSAGSARAVSCTKGGKVWTSLARTAYVADGYYAVSNEWGFRVSDGTIIQAFKPVVNRGTWLVRLTAYGQEYNKAAAYPYRIWVQAEYYYSGTQPNYNPPSISLRNFTIKTTTSITSSSQAGLVDWQTSSTISDTLSLSSSKRTDTSAYIYCKDARVSGSRLSVYVGVQSYSVSSNPSSLAVTMALPTLMIDGLSGGIVTPVDPVNPGGGIVQV